MGVHALKIHIKNSGAVIAFFTFFWSIWYMLTHSQILDLQSDIFLRFVGIGLITLVVSAPYVFLSHILTRVAYPFFIMGSATILIIGDILLRFMILSSAVTSNGFWLFISYSFLFFLGITFTSLLAAVWNFFNNSNVHIGMILLCVRKCVESIIRRRIL